MTDQMVLAWSVLLQHLAKSSTSRGTQTGKKNNPSAGFFLDFVPPAGYYVRREYLFNLSAEFGHRYYEYLT